MRPASARLQFPGFQPRDASVGGRRLGRRQVQHALAQFPGREAEGDPQGRVAALRFQPGKLARHPVPGVFVEPLKQPLSQHGARVVAHHSSFSFSSGSASYTFIPPRQIRDRNHNSAASSMLAAKGQPEAAHGQAGGGRDAVAGGHAEGGRERRGQGGREGNAQATGDDGGGLGQDRHRAGGHDPQGAGIGRPAADRVPELGAHPAAQGCPRQQAAEQVAAEKPAQHAQGHGQGAEQGAEQQAERDADDAAGDRQHQIGDQQGDPDPGDEQPGIRARQEIGGQALDVLAPEQERQDDRRRQRHQDQGQPDPGRCRTLGSRHRPPRFRLRRRHRPRARGGPGWGASFSQRRPARMTGIAVEKRSRRAESQAFRRLERSSAEPWPDLAG
jgi:hypothetical protein